ncbi:BTB/POZ domain-containing protein At3g50780-like [Miscanthus floridulus]|uniref:BTB/POZ domain-containing protein At3g50780-like n=1 Tax=Miscanthus floridulus TaxID=154761 RepID=UPI00345B2862
MPSSHILWLLPAVLLILKLNGERRSWPPLPRRCSDVLSQSSAFFAQRLAAAGNPAPAPPPCVEIHDCEDAEIYVETVGLMYCDEAKHRLLLKQSVPRVLRIMKAADALGFHACVTSCLHYLEAVPWVGDDEERSVVSSIRRLQSKDKDDDCNYYGGVVRPLLKRIASDDCLRPPSDTFASITEMVLTSTDDRGRREMKALVLNLLKDSSCSHVGGGTGADGSPPDDIFSAKTLYRSCRGCLDRLRRLFAEAASSSESEYSPAVTRRIALETDNLLWLVELLAELAASHARVPAPSSHAVSRVTARLFVGVGRGELLLQVWLHPLIDDYAWLQRRGGGGGSRPSSASVSFDRRLVEHGIGQTILTLPLEDQRSILLAWFGRFLKLGDDCQNLQGAFEVWTFVRPYVLHQPDSNAGDVSPLDRSSS